MDGYAEYVNKMTSIQTIKSNTEGKLVEIQWIVRWSKSTDIIGSKSRICSERPIYSFEDMTRNIGTFTAAGVGLDDSAIAIKGIANLAAASGSSLMQALPSSIHRKGKVSLMTEAGMGGELFKNALYDTADWRTQMSTNLRY